MVTKNIPAEIEAAKMLKVTLGSSSKDGKTKNTIIVDRPVIWRFEQGLTISFKRTVRVADNDEENDLPPDLGSFPIYSTED